MRVPKLVSVILPCYDAGPELRDQLDAVGGQDYAGDYEVIVADNGSRSRRTGQASRWAGPGSDARFIDASVRRGPGAARNAGARVARGDFLAFCDADDVVSPSWLSLLVGSAQSADVVGGQLESARLNGSALCACHDLTDPSVPHLDFLPAAAAANLGIWTDVFYRLGGFEEASRTGEDIALVWTAQLRGYVYATSPALVHKRLPAGVRDPARRFFRYGMGDAWLYSHFGSHGMPRRSLAGAKQLGLGLVNGFSTLPPPARWCRWRLTIFLTCGRLAGSVRNRVLFI